MSTFANWFSPTVTRPLGWTLVHFLWQGLALAALLSVAMTVCRKASTRYVAAVVTLLFYHPAIWWVNKRIRSERENCSDDVAIFLCGDAVEYARALTLMEESRSAPALAMAANRGPLAARVARLLGLRTIGSGIRVAGFVASFVFLAGALFASKRGAAWTKRIQTCTKVAPACI